MITKIAFSGRFGSGKDWVATQAGFQIMGFADPMYAIAEYCFGHCDKTRHDIREFLQTVGQWGWGYNDPNTKSCTVERATFVALIRERGLEITGFKGRWKDFGRCEDFWVSILLERVRQTLGRVAVTNMRFPHEEKPLKDDGFEQYLVLCSEETRLERNHKKAGSNFDYLSYQTLSNNISERYSIELLNKIPDDRVIWNDSRPMPAGKGYLQVIKFLETVQSK